MRMVSNWILAAALIGASASAGAQEYTVTDFELGNGDTLTGSINVATSGTAVSVTSATLALFNGQNQLDTLVWQNCTTTCPFSIAPIGGVPELVLGLFGQPAGTVLFEGASDTLSFDSDGNYSLNGAGPSGLPVGPDVFGTAAVTAAPEIDATAAASGLALLIGGLLVLRGRRQQLVAA